MATTFYLFRHGETVAKRAGLISGRNETDLTDEGVAQMRAIGAEHAAWPFVRVVASPLRRAQQSARAFLEGAGKDVPIETIAELAEVSYGEWEGKAEVEYAEVKRAYFAANPRADGDYHVAVGAGVESHADAGARAKRALLDAAARYPDETIPVFTHNGVMRSLLLTGALGEAGKTDSRAGAIPFGGMVAVSSDGETLTLAN